MSHFSTRKGHSDTHNSRRVPILINRRNNAKCATRVRTEQMLQNECLIANFGFVKAENGPSTFGLPLAQFGREGVWTAAAWSRPGSTHWRAMRWSALRTRLPTSGADPFDPTAFGLARSAIENRERTSSAVKFHAFLLFHPVGFQF